MAVRFLADACRRQAIVRGCLRREPAMDFMSAKIARLDGMDDLEVLALASRLGRILVSDRRSPGLLVRQRERIADVIDSLVLIWSASASEEWENGIFYLPL